jgi:hypothetical protein
MSIPANGDHVSDGDDLEGVDDRHRALAERLRRLRWPEPPPGVRERRLEELREVLSRSSAVTRRPPPPGGSEDGDANQD